MSVDLKFAGAFPTDSGGSVELTFGLGDTGTDSGVRIGFTFDDLPVLALTALFVEPVIIDFEFDDLPTMEVDITIDPGVYRGPRVAVSMPWQDATIANVNVVSPWENSTPAPVQIRMPIEPATPLITDEIRILWEQAANSRLERAFAWEEAAHLRPPEISFPAEEATRTQLERTFAWEESIPEYPKSTTFAWEEATQIRATLDMPFEEATPMRLPFLSVAGDAAGLHRSWTIPWDEARHPPLGQSVIIPTPPPPPEPPDLCYSPDPGGDVPLVFSELWDGPNSTELTFVCTNHPVGPPAAVVVPIQEVYMISNSVALTLADGTNIPCNSFSLKLDYQSWTWGLSADVAYSALAMFGFDTSGDPVQVWAHINGETFKLFVQTGQSQRQFPSGNITLTGLGLISVLDAPYSPTLTFDNSTSALNAQQIANLVLTTSGVSIGWDVEWGLTDWLVPAGTWSFQGTYATALQAIAESAGGYMQPHATDQTARILPLYPTLPWDWGTVTPDYELPSSVTNVEGITWSSLPVYNVVYVGGTNSGGVLRAVKRTGTAGDVEAQMVTDQLITHDDAARQRGGAILANTGKQALVSLKLPVLPATGVIVPGKFVRYVDGATSRVGIVRSVQVDVALPAVWQTIGVETHVS